jgi:hypothetical protein
VLIKNRTQKPELRRNLEQSATQRCSLPETGQTHRTARLWARNQERAERWRAAGDAGAHASQDLNKIIVVEPRPSGGCKTYAWRHTSGGPQDGRPEAAKNQTNDSKARRRAARGSGKKNGSAEGKIARRRRASGGDYAVATVTLAPHRVNQTGPGLSALDGEPNRELARRKFFKNKNQAGDRDNKFEQKSKP